MITAVASIGALTRAGSLPLPPLDVHQLVTRWECQPLPLVSLLAVAGLYLWGVQRLSKRGDRWPMGRTFAFVGAIAVAAYAVLGGVAAYDGVLFSAHMAQHMLLAMVVPVLLALGAPITLALRTLPTRPRAVLLTMLQSRVARALSSPLVGLGLFVATPFAFYFTGIYPYTLDHTWAHYLAHVHLVTVGCIFFWPLLGIDPLPHRPPHWARVLVLFLSLPFHAFFGLAIMSATSVIAAGHYARVARTWGSSAINDQYTGGGLIWATGDILGGFIFLTVLIQWSRADEREAKRVDRQLDREDAALDAYNARLAALAAEDAAGR